MAVYMGRAPREATGIWILEASERPGEAEWHGIRTNRRADIFVQEYRSTVGRLAEVYGRSLQSVTRSDS
jgi:hypothetical protein